MQPREPVGALGFLWLELTQHCNLSCVHCYAGSSPKAPTTSLPTPRWHALLHEARALGCREVQFTGGEATLHPDAPFLMGEATRLGYTTVELFTNAIAIDDAWAARMGRAGHRAAVSLYSHDRRVHDAITGLPGSHGATLDGIRRLQAEGVRVRVEIVAMEQNLATLDETTRFVQQELGVRARTKVDPVRPTGRGRPLAATDVRVPVSVPIAPARRLALLPATRAIDPGAKADPTCWSGKLAITPTGRVFPCIFSRELPVGSVEATPLAQVLSSARLLELWSLTLDDVPDCRDCDYKAACFDCRAIAYSSTGDLWAKSPRCTYVPPARRAEAMAGAEPRRFIRAERLTVREVDGEVLVVDGVAGQLHLANATAAALLLALDRPRTLVELSELLVQEFDTDLETATRDALGALAVFQAQQLVDPAAA